MPTLSNPSEIAREALRLLAVRRLSPLPENYRALYHEIAGTTDTAEAAFPEREFKALAASLPRDSALQQKLAKRFETALLARDWTALQGSLSDLVRDISKEQDQPWNELFADFVRGWESSQAGVTVARKRESLERVLAGGASNRELFFGRLQGLVRSWLTGATAGNEIPLVEPAGITGATAHGEPPVSPVANDGPDKAEVIDLELRSLFVYTLEGVIATQLTDEPELAAEAKDLAHKVRTTSSPAATEGLSAALKRFAFRLEILAEDRNELRTGLLNLLQLLIENVGELVVEDGWLTGQIAIVRDIVAKPLSIRSLGDAEHRLKEVIFKQSQLKHSLNEAKDALKQMLAGFVDHLAEFADSTSDYHDKIQVCADKINQAEDIGQLEGVLAEVIRETQIIQLNAQRSRDELRAAKLRVEEAEKRIGELQSELDKASTLVRHDQLTGALNRRGLDEAFAKEAARSQRRRSCLCIALLDIDNFKRLNDSLGHDAGDAALVHLATVIRETMRPQDTVARYGGEEFILLLPDTSIEDAQTAIVRLQRELTKRFFLHNNDRQLITFSAGVTDLRPDDTQTSVTKRADDAMYAAKQAGKNRVVIG